MPELTKSPSDYSQVQESYSDSFSVSLNDFSAILDMGNRGVNPRDPIIFQHRVRMPLPQLKVLALMALRIVRNYEAQNGVTISLPPKLIEALGIPLEDWQGGLR